MKTLTIVAATVMLASAANAGGRNYFSDSARYACVGATRAAGAFMPALSSPNEGVVSSALAHVAMIKLTIPECDLRGMSGKVSAIAARGMTPELRYKAWIVEMLLENPRMFGEVAKAGYEDPDALFAALASRMAAHFAAR